MTKITLSLLLFILLHGNSPAQGGENVKSISIDDIDSNYLNKEVKIDFKGTQKINPESFNWKSIFTSYTKIYIDDKLVDVVSYDGHGTDYWYYDEAYIEVHNYKPNTVFRVSNCVIKELKSDTIKFQWIIREYTNKEGPSGINPETINLWINKSDISSILIRK